MTATAHGGARWRVLVLLFGVRAAAGVQFQALGAVGAPLTAAFGIDWATVGLLVGLFMLPGVLLALPAGYAGRRAADLRLVQAGLAVLVLGGLICALAPAPWALGLGRIASGAGFVLLNIYGTKMVADWFEGREMATALSVLVMSWPFGLALGQVGHAWLADTFGWQAPFLAAAAYGLAAGAALTAFYRPRAPSGAAPASVWMTPAEWRAIALIGLIWGVFNAGYILYLSFGPGLLERMGQAPLAAAGVISLASWVMIASGPLCGRLADQSGRPVAILVGCVGVAALSLVALRLPGAAPAASLALGLIGLAPAGVIVALAGQALRPEARAFGMGVFFTIYYAVMLAAPPVAGALRDATGRADSPLWLAAGLFVLVVPLALAAARARPH